ncbi:hypothetical protein BD626DRAFT_570989 [Schizophyllum amplum]|uniref:Uncharacterized protein n=1 Tax=Schizophyllum amplum TaxID=97359 RepID=A0A550C971_9AGAR|nr:hypothetical protein BD626DRAFT_570989 [Auriculariopsis ampla]
MATSGKGNSTPAGGRPDSDATPAPAHKNPLLHETPRIQTPKNRSPKMRAKVIAIIGQAVCLFTGMLAAVYTLHCIHFVPRSLHRTHPIIYECFRQSIGILNEEDKKVLNLDCSGNGDVAHMGVHIVYDGPGVKKNIGQGDLALVPVDIEKDLVHIERHKGQDYRQLFPEKARTFYVYGLSNVKHVIPRYAYRARTYDSLTSKPRSVQEVRDEDCAGAEAPEPTSNDPAAADSVKATDPSAEESAAYEIPERYTEDDVKDLPEPDSTDEDPISHVLRPGRNEDLAVVSHGNPVFILFDYALKMRYRCDDEQLVKAIPEADVRYFEGRLWPALRHWFVPPGESKHTTTEVTTVEDAITAYSQSTTTVAGVKTDAPGKAAPMAPAPPPRAQTNVEPTPASPLEPRSSPTPADAPTHSSTPFTFRAPGGLRGNFNIRAHRRSPLTDAGDTSATPTQESSSPPPPEITPEPLPHADGFPSPSGDPTWPPKPSRHASTFDPKKAIAQRSGRLMPTPQPPGHASPTAPAASLAALHQDSNIPPDDPHEPPEPESRQSMRDVDEINMPALDPPDAKATLSGLADTAAGSSQASYAPPPKRELRKRVRNGDLKGKGKQKAETPPPTSDSDALDSPEPERPAKKKRGAGVRKDSDEYVPPGKRAAKGGRGTRRR